MHVRTNANACIMVSMCQASGQTFDCILPVSFEVFRQALWTGHSLRTDVGYGNGCVHVCSTWKKGNETCWNTCYIYTSMLVLVHLDMFACTLDAYLRVNACDFLHRQKNSFSRAHHEHSDMPSRRVHRNARMPCQWIPYNHCGLYTRTPAQNAQQKWNGIHTYMFVCTCAHVCTQVPRCPHAHMYTNRWQTGAAPHVSYLCWRIFTRSMLSCSTCW